MGTTSNSAGKTDPKALALVLLVILLIGGAVFLRLWANGQRLAVPTFQAMATTPDGRVLVVVGDTLYVESSNAESLQVIPLSQWGVNDFHGDIAALGDNSVILALGKLGAVGPREAKRIVERAKSVIDPAEPLMRCSLETNVCTVLDGGVSLGRAFGLAVDETAGFIYIAEPAKHRLLQLSMNGEERAVSDAGWRFPNSARVVPGGRVAFVDTNNHRYVEVEAGPGGFGETVRETGIHDWPDIVPLMNFPSEVLKDINDTLWMLVADGSMADATLYRAPHNGLSQKISLPVDADPIALVEAAGSVLIADQQHFRVHRFDLAGQLQPDFGSAVLKSALASRRAEHSRYEMIFDYSLLAVLVIALPALFVGMKLQSKARSGELSASAEASAEVVTVGDDATAQHFSSLAAQYAQIRGEFVFLRKFTVLDTAGDRMMMILGGFLLLAMFAILVHMQILVAERNNETLFDAFTPERALLIGGFGLFGAIAWLSMMFERLVVSREGIRYVSFMPGVLARWILPSWSLRWDQVESVTLHRKGSGTHPLMWRYEIPGKDGRKRFIHPLSWRLAGEPETGLGLTQVLRRNSGAIRDVIHRTWLYRLLGASTSRG